MSFETNDMNTIHRGNYEEFFILYMDNELSADHVKMVDEFLVANPDLEAEFEILMSTKLPMEDFSFDKKDLLAENMKLSSVDEELLLYIDNELPAVEKEKVEAEIAVNKDYQLQHRLLLQAKLDPSEKIEYPNKKELYRRTERVIAFKMWMRVAAAVVIVAVAGIVYFKKPPAITTANDGTQITAGTNPAGQNIDSEKRVPVIEQSSPVQNDLASSEPSLNETKSNRNIERREVKEDAPVPQNVIALTKLPQEDITVERSVKRNVQSDETNNTIALVEHKVSVNNPDVTSPSLERTIPEASVDKTSTDNDRKGSIKGFLRKATRLIEKRTGIDPTNNGELLIGAVAINLK